jgi:mono/diheme cytochrome c family protein
MVSRAGLAAHCAAAALAILPAALAGQSADSSARAPSYSAAQASSGGAAYQTFCVSCHDDGYHTAAKFQQKWSGRTVYELFTTLRATMPDDNPGGLSSDDYVRVIAYILKQNGVPAGADSLAADSLRMSHMRLTLPDSAR